MLSSTKKHEPTRPFASPRAEGDQRWATLKRDLHHRLIKAVDHLALRNMDEAQLRQQLRLGAEELCRSWPELLSVADRARLIDELVDETLGLGPLERLLRDPSVSDILINGPRAVFVERRGVLEATSVTFHSDEHLLATVQKIVGRVGRRIDESSPMVDARLPDGSRVNAIIPPLAVDGALVSIRRFDAGALSADQLVAGGALSTDMLHFLAAAVRAKLNILISGGTGSGKTTLLNLLSGFIPASERLVTIEDAVELRLRQPHVARLETRPPNLEGAGEVTARDLLRNALRMRPDRIIVGECRGTEAFDMLQAMNTGHDGSLTTLHANSAADAMARLSMLVSMAGLDLEATQVDRQIAAAIHLVVQVARLSGGVRKITQIAEVRPAGRQGLQLCDLFRFCPTGIDASGLASGRFAATGEVPQLLEKLAAAGVPLDVRIFAPQDRSAELAKTPATNESKRSGAVSAPASAAISPAASVAGDRR